MSISLHRNDNSSPCRSPVDNVNLTGMSNRFPVAEDSNSMISSLIRGPSCDHVLDEWEGYGIGRIVDK